jgi:hypothetical protein
VSKSVADRITDHVAPLLALKLRRRFREDAVLIVDGTLVPTRDRAVAEQSKNHRYSTNHQVVIDATYRLRLGSREWLSLGRGEVVPLMPSTSSAGVRRQGVSRQPYLA